MEEHLKDLNKTLNRMMSEEPKFKEDQRANIRQAISKTRQRKPLDRNTWMAVASVAACLILIVGALQYVFTHNGYDASMESASSGAESAADAGASADSAAKTAAIEKRIDENTELKRESEPFQDSTAFDKAARVIDTKTIESPVLPLNEKLLDVYETFSKSGDQSDLAGLEPFEVMQLYYYAAEQEDHGTQYDLYYQDPSASAVSKQDFIQNAKQESDMEKSVERLSNTKSFNLEIQLNAHDEKEAYVTWGGTGESMKFFRLIYNEQLGVWTVSWTPIQ